VKKNFEYIFLNSFLKQSNIVEKNLPRMEINSFLNQSYIVKKYFTKLIIWKLYSDEITDIRKGWK